MSKSTCGKGQRFRLVAKVDAIQSGLVTSAVQPRPVRLQELQGAALSRPSFHFMVLLNRKSEENSRVS